MVISISIRPEAKKKWIHFRDSALLLPGSLADICKHTRTQHQKLSFPHQFVTAENLTYVGEEPAVQFYPEQD